MAASPHKAIQFASKRGFKPDYIEFPPEPFVHVRHDGVPRMTDGAAGPAPGPCRTCRYSEGWPGRVYSVGGPGKAMLCRRAAPVLLLEDKGLDGCQHWEREPGADDE